MIVMQKACKTYRTGEGRRIVLDEADLVIPDDVNIGILGANGAGKSTLVRLLSGVEALDRGTIKRTGSVSFPLGFGGTFDPLLSGRENVRFLARVYGANVDQVLDYAENFAELGSYFRMPVHSYSSGMHARLAFGACLAIRFDTYLIDEVIAVGDTRFRAKCLAALGERLAEANTVLISHDPGLLRLHCSVGAVLTGGRFHCFDDIDEAIELHEKLQQEISTDRIEEARTA